MRLSLLAASLALFGCTIDLEVEQTASGRFSGLSTFESAGKSFAAVLEEGTLAIVSLEDRSMCRAGPATVYEAHDGAGGAVVVTWSAEAGVGFVDTACRALSSPIAGMAAPARIREHVFGDAWRNHLAIESAEGELVLVEPWSGDVLALAERAQAWHWHGATALWLLEDEVLALHDLSLGVPERRRAGEAVREATWLPDGTMAWVDALGLWVLRDDADAPERVAEDACGVRALSGGELGYFAPCSDRRLSVWRPSDGAVVVVADDVTAVAPSSSPLFFLREGASTGELYFAELAGAQSFVASGVPLASLRATRHDDREQHLFLCEHDGEQGRLCELDGDTRVVAERVREFEVRHDHLAALSDVREGAGTLLLWREGAAQGEALAGGVPRYGFAEQLDALAFIADSSIAGGRLEVLVLPTGDRLEVDEGVSELAEVRSGERPGIAYLIGDGPRAGVWFATPE